MKILFSTSKLNTPAPNLLRDIKRSFILFDDIIFDIGNDKTLNRFLNQLTKQDFVPKKNHREFNKVINTSSSQITDYKNTIWQPGYIDLKKEPLDLIKTIAPTDGISYPKFNESLLELSYYRIELAQRIANLNELMQRWAILNSDNGCILYTVEQETASIEAILNKSEPKPKSTFENLFDLTDIPDVGNLPWNDIFKLRKSSFGESFRNTLKKILKMLSISDFENSKTIFQDFKNNQLMELALSVKPNINKTVFTAIGSNIPLPFPNPIGIADGLNSVEQAKNLADKFGWIYFVNDLKNVRDANNVYKT